MSLLKSEKLPERTVERLSKYRRVLLSTLEKGKEFIFSHELANLLHITSVQVRRDIMLIGYTGTLRKGYHVPDLIDIIGTIIDCKIQQNVMVIGVGNFGKAIIQYIDSRNTSLHILASLDINPEEGARFEPEIPCYHINKMSEVIKKHKISIAILTVPKDQAESIAQKLITAGIKGIMNFTPTPLNVHPHAYLEEYDMITSLEKVAYFSKPKFFNQA